MLEKNLAQIKIIEELSLNALPCLQQTLDDGWVLRFAEGYTKRANSVTPLYPGSQNLSEKIQRCQQIYDGFKLKPIFRLANTPDLESLDWALERQGYIKQDLVSVCVKDLTDTFFLP